MGIGNFQWGHYEEDKNHLGRFLDQHSRENTGKLQVIEGFSVKSEDFKLILLKTFFSSEMASLRRWDTEDSSVLCLFSNKSSVGNYQFKGYRPPNRNNMQPARYQNIYTGVIATLERVEISKNEISTSSFQMEKCGLAAYFFNIGGFWTRWIRD